MVSSGFVSALGANTNASNDALRLTLSDRFTVQTSDAISSRVKAFLTEDGLAKRLIDSYSLRELEGYDTPIVSASGRILSTDRTEPKGKPITEEEYKQSPFYREDISYYKGMTEESAELLNERAVKRDKRDYIISRATTKQKISAYGIGFISSFVDPVNIATAFVPVPVLSAKLAAGIHASTSLAGKVKLRAFQGAAEGAFGSALVEPLMFGTAQSLQEDYTMLDSLLNISVGAFVGAGLHTGINFRGDRRTVKAEKLQTLSLRAHQQAESLAIKQLMEGKKVDVEPFVKANLKTKDPFDPNEIFSDDIQITFDAGPAKGKGTGQRFTEYTRISEADRFYVQAAADEVTTSKGGGLTFIYNEDAPGSKIVSNDGNTPEWFQNYNAESRKANAARTRQKNKNRKAMIGDEGLPSTVPSLTREKVGKVAQKLLDGAPLGKAEAEVASLLTQRASELKARDVQAKENNFSIDDNDFVIGEREEIDAMIDRSLSYESDWIGDAAYAKKVEEDGFEDYVADLQQQVDELEARADEFDDQYRQELKEIEVLDDLNLAVNRASLCMRGNL